MSALVLVAEDDPFNLRLLQEVCEAAGHRVATSANGREVLDSVARERPDVILMAIDLPVIDGFEVMRVLKSDPELCAVPVIVVTAADDLEHRSRSIECGAEDYVTKPYRVFEIQQRLRNTLRLRAAQHAVAEAQESAFVDPLTRAGSAQQLHISLNYEFTRALRYGHPLTVFALRLRNAKQLREAEERVLDAAVAQMVKGFRTCIRNIDHLYRNRAHELVAVLPETDDEGAQVVQKRVEDSLETGSFWVESLRPAPCIDLTHVSYPKIREISGDALLGRALRNLPE